MKRYMKPFRIEEKVVAMQSCCEAEADGLGDGVEGSEKLNCL